MHQRIGRLTPLADVLAAIAGVEPVAPREIAIGGCAGLRARNRRVCHRGFATGAASPCVTDGPFDSDATRDAGPYAPLTLQPPPERVDAFAALAAGTDAVAPLDAVSALGGMMQIMTPAATG